MAFVADFAVTQLTNSNVGVRSGTCCVYCWKRSEPEAIAGHRRSMQLLTKPSLTSSA